MNTHEYIDTNTLIAYTSGTDVAVEKDQYLSIYGIDENKRVQRFVSHKVLEDEIQTT